MDTNGGRRKRVRARRLGGVALSLALIAGACGGSDEEGDDIADFIDEVLDGAEGVGDQSDGNGTQSSDGGGGTVTPAGAPPDGAVEIGETYAFELVDPNTVLTLSIPAGSVTTAEIAGDEANIGPVSMRTDDGSFSLIAEPGNASASEQDVITATEAGLDTRVTINGSPGDVISLTIDSTEQLDDPDGGDAPAIITGAVALSGERTGLLGNADQIDYFVLDAEAGDIIDWSIAQSAESAGSITAVLEFNGERKDSLQASPGGSEEARYVVSAEEVGSWYLQMIGQGTYTAAVATAPQPDGGQDGDAGAEIAGARDVSVGTIPGLLGNADQSDVFRFPIPDSAVITLELRSDPTSTGTLNGRILVNGEEVGRTNVAAGGSSDLLTAVLPSGNAEEAYLELWGRDIGYEAVVTADAQADGGTPGDAGYDVGEAKLIEDTEFSGVFGNEDNGDALSIVAPAAGTVEVSLTNDPSADAFNALLYVDGVEATRDNLGAGATKVLATEVAAGATVSIVVRGNRATYEVAITGTAFPS